MPSPAKLFNRFRAADTNGRLDFCLSWRASEDPLKKPCSIWSGSRDPRCYVVRENVCHVNTGYGFRINTPFILALNNQRCLLMHSRTIVWHRMMPRWICQVLLATLYSDNSFFFWN